MKKKYKKKKIKTGVIAASAFGITATVVLAVVLLTTGIKEDTSKTDDILMTGKDPGAESKRGFGAGAWGE